jgi:hypothetical protein
LDDATPTSLATIVGSYIRHYRPPAEAELEFYAALPSKTVAIEWAGLAKRPDGKRHDHQKRIPLEVLREAHTRLGTLKLETYSTFDALQGAVGDAIGAIHGVGELMVYDASVRIGAKLNLQPDFVYLHAGTRLGAQALGLPTALGRLEVAQLPSAFRPLSAREIEDCLCIYKSQLAELRPAGLTQRYANSPR